MIYAHKYHKIFIYIYIHVYLVSTNQTLPPIPVTVAMFEWRDLVRSSGIFSIFGVVIGVSKTPGPGCNVVLKVQPFVSKQWPLTV